MRIVVDECRYVFFELLSANRFGEPVWRIFGLPYRSAVKLDALKLWALGIVFKRHAHMRLLFCVLEVAAQILLSGLETSVKP